MGVHIWKKATGSFEKRIRLGIWSQIKPKSKGVYAHELSGKLERELFSWCGSGWLIRRILGLSAAQGNGLRGERLSDMSFYRRNVHLPIIPTPMADNQADEIKGLTYKYTIPPSQAHAIASVHDSGLFIPVRKMRNPSSSSTHTTVQ